MRITQKQIAMEAKVSQALVSLILSEGAVGSAPRKGLRVSPETRQKVLDTAQRLGYRSKASVRSAAGDATLFYLGRLHSEGEALGDGWGRLVGKSRGLLVQNGLIDAVSREGVNLSMRLLAHESDLRSSLHGDAVGGVFLGTAIPELREHLGPKVPIIAVGGRHISEGDVVLEDERELIVRAVEFLHQNGHSRIVLLNAGVDPATAALREVVFAEAVKERGICPGEWDVRCSDPVQLLDRVLDPLQPPESRPTAVIAEESFALALRAEAIRRGCSLPEELSVMGLGGSEMSVLTTVGVDAGEMARAALMLMNERLQNQSDGVHAYRKIEIAATVTDRGSVASRSHAMQDRPSSSRIPPKNPCPDALSGF